MLKGLYSEFGSGVTGSTLFHRDRGLRLYSGDQKLLIDHEIVPITEISSGDASANYEALVLHHDTTGNGLIQFKIDNDVVQEMTKSNQKLGNLSVQGKQTDLQIALDVGGKIGLGTTYAPTITKKPLINNLRITNGEVMLKASRQVIFYDRAGNIELEQEINLTIMGVTSPSSPDYYEVVCEPNAAIFKIGDNFVNTKDIKGSETITLTLEELELLPSHQTKLVLKHNGAEKSSITIFKMPQTIDQGDRYPNIVPILFNYELPCKNSFILPEVQMCIYERNNQGQVVNMAKDYIFTINEELDATIDFDGKCVFRNTLNQNPRKTMNLNGTHKIQDITRTVTLLVNINPNLQQQIRLETPEALGFFNSTKSIHVVAKTIGINSNQNINWTIDASDVSYQIDADNLGATFNLASFSGTDITVTATYTNDPSVTGKLKLHNLDKKVNDSIPFVFLHGATENENNQYEITTNQFLSPTTQFLIYDEYALVTEQVEYNIEDDDKIDTTITNDGVISITRAEFSDTKEIKLSGTYTILNSEFDVKGSMNVKQSMVIEQDLLVKGRLMFDSKRTIRPERTELLATNTLDVYERLVLKDNVDLFFTTRNCRIRGNDDILIDPEMSADGENKKVFVGEYISLDPNGEFICKEINTPPGILEDPLKIKHDILIEDTARISEVNNAAAFGHTSRNTEIHFTESNGISLISRDVNAAKCQNSSRFFGIRIGKHRNLETKN